MLSVGGSGSSGFGFIRRFGPIRKNLLCLHLFLHVHRRRIQACRSDRPGVQHDNAYLIRGRVPLVRGTDVPCARHCRRDAAVGGANDGNGPTSVRILFCGTASSPPSYLFSPPLASPPPTYSPVSCDQPNRILTFFPSVFPSFVLYLMGPRIRERESRDSGHRPA
jgi:hypothetical protein